MRTPLGIIVALAASAALAEDAPSSFTEKAPSGRFSITQRWVRPEWLAANTDCSDADCGWEASLQFADDLKPRATLAAQPEWYSWPADYHISPDEEWIIRDQKTGSGENALFLYHIERDGRVWRLSQHLDDLVWSALLAPSHLTRADYYHMEVVLVSWDLAAGKVRLKARATPEDKDEKKVISGRSATYDLRKHIVTPQ
jgi:hypothetical protein